VLFAFSIRIPHDKIKKILEHGAISRAQYDKSLGDLTEKMGMEPKV
jgi:hypothetical protein